jgi:hypothetical protein
LDQVVGRHVISCCDSCDPRRNRLVTQWRRDEREPSQAARRLSARLVRVPWGATASRCE